MQVSISVAVGLMVHDKCTSVAVCLVLRLCNHFLGYCNYWPYVLNVQALWSALYFVHAIISLAIAIIGFTSHPDHLTFNFSIWAPLLITD